jgi:outer membrane murein-binding lipoprotein Lpp
LGKKNFMIKSLLKRVKKDWFLIIAVIIAVGITSSCTAKSVKSSQKKSELEKAIEEYNSLVAELDSDLEVYRASMPVFANFMM